MFKKTGFKPVTQRANLSDANVPQTSEAGDVLLQEETEVTNQKNVTDDCYVSNWWSKS